MNQHQQILEYISINGSITPMQAYSDLGITKLATRISEMRKAGREFHIVMVKVKNRHEKEVRVARYSFPKEEDDE